MKHHDILCLSLIVLVTRTAALVYSRHEGLFPSFDDPYNTPTDTQLMAEGLGYVGRKYYIIIIEPRRKKSKRKAMNRNWYNQKANPALNTKAGNK